MGFKLQAQELAPNVQRYLIARVMKANYWSADQGSSTQVQCTVAILRGGLGGPWSPRFLLGPPVFFIISRSSSIG